MLPEQPGEERLLVLAPLGRDAHVIEQVLTRDGLHCVICADYQSLLNEIKRPAGAALIAEEALRGADLAGLTDWLSHQPSWSDFPFVILISRHAGKTDFLTHQMLKSLGNIVLLERPVNAETLCRAAASALRARRRQYQARHDLQQRIASEERLRLALQAGHLGPWEMTLGSGALWTSKVCKANFGRRENDTFSYDDLIAAIHPDDFEWQRRTVQAAIDAHSDFDIEIRVFWPDGTLHWVHMQGKVNCDADGRPVELVGVSQDVTERREADRQLRESQTALLDLNATLESRIQARTAELAQANDRLMREMTERERAQMALVQTHKMEALGHLTSGISHDFNNLLSVIQGNADLLMLLSTDERIKRMATTIRKAAKQGAKLTGQLLAFSRGQRLDLKAIDLNTTLEGIKDLLVASLGSSVRIEYALTPDIPQVKADVTQIELAVLNLSINAKDAMPNGGSVTIRTCSRPAPEDLPPDCDYAVISVIDSGEGINPEIIGKVFDPFFTTKPLGKGTGLGLSQVYGIAQQSGGTVKIHSTVGVGTTVEIWLPFANCDDISEAVPRGEIQADGESRRACILVVEDDERVRQFIVESLETLGYQVIQADHGQAGLDALGTMQPDLLITDFLMPGMTGADVVKQAHVRFPRLPVIIATGYADMQAIDEVIDPGMILQKPFQLNDLAHKVRQALSGSRQQPAQTAEVK